MEFTIPQFIEKEPRIVGPFTIKQFAFIGAAIVISVFLYYTAPFSIFIILSAVILSAGFSLAFLKINGLAFPIVIKNMFFFILKPRVYLWEKERSFQNIEYGEKRKEKKPEKKSPVNMQRKSNIEDLFTKLETKK